MTDKNKSWERAAAASESLLNPESTKGYSSDALNVLTYGKPTKLSEVDSYNFVNKALEAADAEKSRESNRPTYSDYKGMKKGGKVKSASAIDKDAKIKPMKTGGKVVKCPYDGIAERGKTRAKFK